MLPSSQSAGWCDLAWDKRKFFLTESSSVRRIKLKPVVLTVRLLLCFWEYHHNLVAVLHNQTLLCSHTGPNPKITCKQRHRVLFFDVEFILHIVFWFCETLTDRLYRCWSEQTKPPTYHVLVKPKKMQWKLQCRWQRKQSDERENKEPQCCCSSAACVCVWVCLSQCNDYRTWSTLCPGVQRCECGGWINWIWLWWRPKTARERGRKREGGRAGEIESGAKHMAGGHLVWH